MNSINIKQKYIIYPVNFLTILSPADNAVLSHIIHLNNLNNNPRNTQRLRFTKNIWLDKTNLGRFAFDKSVKRLGEIGLITIEKKVDANGCNIDYLVNYANLNKLIRITEPLSLKALLILKRNFDSNANIEQMDVNIEQMDANIEQMDAKMGQMDLLFSQNDTYTSKLAQDSANFRHHINNNKEEYKKKEIYKEKAAADQKIILVPELECRRLYKHEFEKIIAESPYNLSGWKRLISELYITLNAENSEIELTTQFYKLIADILDNNNIDLSLQEALQILDFQIIETSQDGDPGYKIDYAKIKNPEKKIRT